MTLSGDVPLDGSINSPVMHETLTVIDEHITDMSTPRQSTVSKDMRNNSLRGGGDSGSEYSSRLSYINGQETEEEESNLHTEEEVMSWSPTRVAEYLEDVGVDKKHCAVFREQEINGEVLLGMDQATIFLKEFELGPVGPRLRTWLKIKALQQEVKDLKDAKAAISAFDGPGDPGAEQRNRATSMSALLPRIPSLSEGSRGKPVLRASSTATQAPVPLAEATSPLIHNVPVSPVPGAPPPRPSSRPSAASVRELSHNRRHSSIDQTTSPPFPTKSQTLPTTSSHKKIPSFDRNWTMGSPTQTKQAPEPPRPSSSNHAPTRSINAGDGEVGFPSIANDLDRGYFSGGEVENRRSRNVLRKREGSTGHARNPSFGNDSGRGTPFNKRHSRVGSTGSVAASGSPISPAAKQYYGTSVKNQRSTGTFDFIRPLKQMNEGSPTVTKLSYQDSPSIDAIANSPGIASETSSLGRASPSPAHHSHSFFGKKSKNTGLRAISDAITGGEKSNASASQLASPTRDSPLQSPARTGSTTPSGTSATKSLELENSDLNKSFTSLSTSSRRKSKKDTSAYRRGREKITPAEAIANCDYSGWMKKKSSSLMTTWKTRLFVLRGRRLSYFYSENDTEEKGLIDISSHRVLPANNERMTGLHAALTRAGSTPTSPHDATIPTNASSDSRKTAFDQDVSGMFIFKLVPPRAGLQKGVQFTKPIVHYFAVDNIQLGRLWMAALMKATIDRDDSVAVTTTYQQKTISLEKARAMRQRPPALMDEGEAAGDEGDGEGDGASTMTAGTGHKSSKSVKEDVIHEEDEMMGRETGLAISGLDDAKALLDFAEGVDGEEEKDKDKGKEGDLKPPRSSGSGREKDTALS